MVNMIDPLYKFCPKCPTKFDKKTEKIFLMSIIIYFWWNT
jgi:hypothetical protein